MSRHQRASKRKLAPSLVLALSLASVGSPLIALFATESKTVKDAPPLVFLPPVSEQAKSVTSATAAVLAKAKRVAPTYTAIRETTSSSQIPVSTATRQPEKDTDPPSPTTSTRRTADRPVQSAPSTAVAVKQAPAVQSSTQKPQVVRQTSKPTTTAPKPPPPKPKPIPTTTKTTTKPIPTTTTKETIPDPPKAPSPLPVRSPNHQLLAQIAQKYVGQGIPYQMGGNSLSGGMDCSHFVWMVLKEAGYNVQYRDSRGLAAWTSHISSPQPGDLVLFNGHVGIFVGNGKMIDQGSSGGAHLREIKYYDNFIGYGRLPI